MSPELGVELIAGNRRWAGFRLQGVRSILPGTGMALDAGSGNSECRRPGRMPGGRWLAE